MSNATKDTVDAGPRDTPMYADTSENTDPVALVGYPPKKNAKGVRRLYKQPGSATYVEIKAADVVDPPSTASKSRLPSGQIVIWVRCSAHIVLVEYDVEDTSSWRWPRR